MELRLGYLKIVFLIERKEKNKKKSCKGEPNLQNNKRNVYVDKNTFDGINHIFIYPNR